MRPVRCSPAAWCDGVRSATLDLSSTYRVVFATMLPDAVPFLGERRRSLRSSGSELAGSKNEIEHSPSRSLPKHAEKWLSITANGFSRPPPPTPRMPWSSSLSVRPR